jgi:hypothetical protein
LGPGNRGEKRKMPIDPTGERHRPVPMHELGIPRAGACGFPDGTRSALLFSRQAATPWDHCVSTPVTGAQQRTGIRPPPSEGQGAGHYVGPAPVTSVTLRRTSVGTAAPSARIQYTGVCPGASPPTSSVQNLNRASPAPQVLLVGLFCGIVGRPSKVSLAAIPLGPSSPCCDRARGPAVVARCSFGCSLGCSLRPLLPCSVPERHHAPRPCFPRSIALPPYPSLPPPLRPLDIMPHLQASSRTPPLRRWKRAGGSPPPGGRGGGGPTPLPLLPRQAITPTSYGTSSQKYST